MSKVDRETAQQDLERLCSTRHLDTSTDKMSEDQKEGFQACWDRVLDAIEEGHLTVDEEGAAVLSPAFTPDAKPIKWGTPTGAMYVAADGAGEGRASRNVAMIAQVTGAKKAEIERLGKRDFEVCVALIQLFLV